MHLNKPANFAYMFLSISGFFLPLDSLLHCHLNTKFQKSLPKKYLFLSQMTLLRWLTFLHGSQTVILIVLLFWTYFFLLTLVFVLQWLFLLWEILIMLLCQFPLTFQQIHNGIPHFIAYLMTIRMLIRMFFVII